MAAATTARKLTDRSFVPKGPMQTVLRAHRPPPLRFRFDEEKALQIAAALLRRRQKGIERRRLSTLLYLVDREALRRFGMPAIGGTYAAARCGPVIQEAHVQIVEGGDPASPSTWDRYFAHADDELRLRQDPGDGALCDADLTLAEEVLAAGIDPRALPEWVAPTHGLALIRPEQLLALLGKSQREIDEIAAESAYFSAVDDELAVR